MNDRHDVVIVGAGRSGLSLALGLARSGVDVVVLEKEPATAEHSRAPAIWPGTREILSRLGVIKRFLEEGISVSRLNLWDADRQRVLLALPIEQVRDATVYPQLLILPQSRTERLLYETLCDETDAEVCFSSEVPGLRQDASAFKRRSRPA